VIGVGLPGARSDGPTWRIVSPQGSASRTIHPTRTGTSERVCDAPPKRRLARRALYALQLLMVRLRPCVARQLYWSANPHIRRLQACAQEFTADVWLANDWNTLPLAAWLAREKGGVYGYDTHEFAVEEYGEKRSWRFWHRPMVRVIEAEFIRGAAVVSTVSSGIAGELNRLYALPRQSKVVRNTPNYQRLPFRPTGAAIRVLYHGLVAPGRGLEATIASVAHWRSDFELTIRGPGNTDYLESLRRRIGALNLADRVRLLPPVPMTELIRRAASFDIGLFALPGTSLHNRFALPNKLFEYIMAGLALCVSNLPEMAQLVTRYHVGITFDAAAPEALAAAINALDKISIDDYKRASLIASRTLCWEREGELLVSAYEAVREPVGASVPALAAV
jgi:glycosyltransferase involved in cell wall biosynthesis